MPRHRHTEEELIEAGDDRASARRQRPVAEGVQVAAACLAVILIPFGLGARQAHPLIFLAFVPVAGMGLTLGARLTRRLPPPLAWDRFLREAIGRAVVIFLVGGLLYILGCLLFKPAVGG